MRNVLDHILDNLGADAERSLSSPCDDARELPRHVMLLGRVGITMSCRLLGAGQSPMKESAHAGFQRTT